MLLIADAGAYGFSMANTYNLRALPAEDVIGRELGRAAEHRATMTDWIFNRDAIRTFRFVRCAFDAQTGVAQLVYAFDDGPELVETVTVPGRAVRAGRGARRGGRSGRCGCCT